MSPKTGTKHPEDSRENEWSEEGSVKSSTNWSDRTAPASPTSTQRRGHSRVRERNWSPSPRLAPAPQPGSDSSGAHARLPRPGGARSPRRATPGCVRGQEAARGPDTFIHSNTSAKRLAARPRNMEEAASREGP